MFFRSQWRDSRHYSLAFILLMPLIVPSCGWFEEVANKTNSREPVDVTVASFCTDNSVAVSETLVLNPQASEYRELWLYFKEKRQN